MSIDKNILADLVKRMQSGEEKAFDDIYYLTNQSAYFVAFKITKNKEDALDILQESYMTVLDKIYDISNPESFESWFNQIVANKARDYIKKKKASLFEFEEDEDPVDFLPDDSTEYSPHDNLDKKATLELVNEIIDELSEKDCLCVVLYYFNEMSIPEIASSVGIPEGTVKSRLFKSRKEIKNKVRALEENGVRLYGAAPIPLVIWALKATGKYVGASFAESTAATAVLTGTTAAAGAAGVATAASAGAATAAGTGAATAAGATAATAAGATAATAAATGTGIVAKIAAFTVVQKVAAGIVVAGVVSGAAIGTTEVVKKTVESEKASDTTTAISEELSQPFSYDYNNIVFEDTTKFNEENSEYEAAVVEQSTKAAIPVIANAQPTATASVMATVQANQNVEHTTATKAPSLTTVKVSTTVAEKTTKEKRTLKSGVTKATTTARHIVNTQAAATTKPIVKTTMPQIEATVPIKEIKVSPNQATLDIREILQLSAVVTPNNATNKDYVWSSSDKNVAAVSESGLVTAISAGTATITAKTTDGNKTATCVVTVSTEIMHKILEPEDKSVGVEVDYPSGCFGVDDSKVTLRVENISQGAGAAQSGDFRISEGGKLTGLYNISPIDDIGNAIQPNCKVAVRIPAPQDNRDGDTVNIYHWRRDGKTERFNAVVTNGIIEVQTDCF